MELSGFQLGMLTAAALAGGGGVGWWLRGRFHSTQRVIMDELWTRKIKSYQATTAAAQEAQTLAATEQAEARKRMERALSDAAEAQHLLAEQQGLEVRLRASLEKHRERIAEASLELERLHDSLEAERAARQQDAERTSKLERRARSLAAYPARLEEREAELARLEVRLAELGKEKSAEITRLTDWVAELTPLTETLERRTEELAALQTTRRSDEQAARQREETLRGELEKSELALRKLAQRQQRAREERDRDRAARAAAERAGQELQASLRRERDARRALEESQAELARALELKERELEEARERISRVTQELDELTTQLHELEARAEDQPAHDVLIPLGSSRKSAPRVHDESPAGPAGRASERTRDDLTRIRGIGAKVAAKLDAAGIESFEALGALEGEPLERLAREIGVPVKRILNEGWIDSARSLR